jgi:hypothetical protein
LSLLVNRGFADFKVRGESDRIVFNGRALAWYREQTAPSDDGVQRAIGKYLYRQFQEHEDLQPFDFDAVASVAKVPVQRIKAQLKVLSALRIIKDRTG